MNQEVASPEFKQAMMSLESLCEQSSLEAFNPMAVPGMFKNLVKTVFDTFSFTSKFADVKDIEALPKDQEKFLRLINAMPYTSIGDLDAVTVEGMSHTWLEFLHLLVPATEELKSLQSGMIDPYVAFLAQFVSDKKFSNDTFSDKKRLEALTKKTQASYAAFGRLYGKESYKARTRVKNVVARNADWREVFKQCNKAIANLETIDRERIKSQIKLCTDYIEIILGEFSKSTDRKVSQEAANRLSSTAYVIARELEYFSTTYYRVLSLRASIQTTMDKVRQAID